MRYSAKLRRAMWLMKVLRLRRLCCIFVGCGLILWNCCAKYLGSIISVQRKISANKSRSAGKRLVLKLLGKSLTVNKYSTSTKWLWAREISRSTKRKRKRFLTWSKQGNRCRQRRNSMMFVFIVWRSLARVRVTSLQNSDRLSTNRTFRAGLW